MRFCLYQGILGTNFIFRKSIFKIKKKLQKHCRFYENFMAKQTSPSFLNNPLFSPTPPFLEKIFHPHPYCQIRELEEVRGFELWAGIYLLKVNNWNTRARSEICSKLIWFRSRLDSLIKVTQEETDRLRKQEMIGWFHLYKFLVPTFSPVLCSYLKPFIASSSITYRIWICHLLIQIT